MSRALQIVVRTVPSVPGLASENAIIENHCEMEKKGSTILPEKLFLFILLLFYICYTFADNGP